MARLPLYVILTDDKRDDGDKTYARLGFKGETQINGSNDWFWSLGIWIFKGYNDEANGSRGQESLIELSAHHNMILTLYYTIIRG